MKTRMLLMTDQQKYVCHVVFLYVRVVVVLYIWIWMMDIKHFIIVFILFVVFFSFRFCCFFGKDVFIHLFIIVFIFFLISFFNFF